MVPKSDGRETNLELLASEDLHGQSRNGSLFRWPEHSWRVRRKRGGAATHVDGDEVDLGVTVLASLGSRHVDNLQRAGPRDNVSATARHTGSLPANFSTRLAGTALDDDVT
jgi:hypothetical protein